MRDLPRPQDTHDEKVQEDIVSTADDLSVLRRFEEACGDTYPEWSDRARSAIDASEFETVEGRLANDRLDQYQAADDGNPLRDTQVLPRHFGDDKGNIREI